MITTKPYISSSNYIRKMSDYKKAAWMDTWDGLYWRFIHKHRDFFWGNARLAMMTSHLKRMPADKLQAHINNAEAFLTTL
jgi:deoxyribodipyrimidine photolyase-related protein